MKNDGELKTYRNAGTLIGMFHFIDTLTSEISGINRLPHETDLFFNNDAMRASPTLFAR